VLATPIPAVMAMDWPDMLRWFLEARRIDSETWGLWRARP
jgi:hypothetical protein